MTAGRDWAYWWSLPGPAEYVRSIIDDIRAGRNVVVGLPDRGPPGLSAAIERQVSWDDLLLWRKLTADETKSSDPLQVLTVRYAPDVGDKGLGHESALVESADFEGHVVWVVGAGGETGRRWLDFISAYSAAAGRKSAISRGVVCVEVVGESTEMFPRGDGALSVRIWADYVTDLDMMAWIHHFLAKRKKKTSIERRIRVALVMQLAAYDAALVQEAIDKPLASLVDPSEWLAEIAVKRNWESTVAWRCGNCDRMDGAETIHPAMLALDDRKRTDIERLVWRAQVGVLLPLVEEARTRCLRKYGALLKVPHDVGNGNVIRKKEDLEIGHIHSQLKYKVEEGERKRFQLLRDVRNSLAHGQPLNGKVLKKVIAEAGSVEHSNSEAIGLCDGFGHP